MKRTQEQEKIITDLVDLCKNKYFNLSFPSVSDGFEKSPNLFKRGRVVNLILPEPSDGDYQGWIPIIEDAKRLLELTNEEVEYSKNHPNFFTALNAIISDAYPNR